MKGITAQEAQVLREMDGPVDATVRDAKERELLSDLVEQGRATVRTDRWEDDEYKYSQRTWEITAQGREALRLFEKLRGEA